MDEIRSQRPADPAGDRVQTSWKESNWYYRCLLGIFIFLVAAVETTGIIYLQREQSVMQHAAQANLNAIADLKVHQIVSWRNERQGDGRFFSRAAFVFRDVQAFLADPLSPAARKEMLDWMNLLKAGDRYAQVTLFDTRLEPRLSVPSRAISPGPIERKLLAAALQSNEVTFTELYRDEATGQVFMDVFVPVFPPSPGGSPIPPAVGKETPADRTQRNEEKIPPAAAHRIPSAMILLRLDPHQFLYPLVQSWPLPNRSAETYLVRRDGDNVLFLNELRQRKNTALTLRFPLTRPNLLAAMAARGTTGIIEGEDYQGVPVVAAVRAIAESSWIMVAKIDQSELYAPQREKALTLGLVLAGLLVLAMGGVVVIWRQRDVGFLRREQALESERRAMTERSDILMRHASDIILLADSEWNIIEANERAVESYGYATDEFIRMKLIDLRAPHARASFSHHLGQIQPGGHAFFETNHQRKDGTFFPVEVSVRFVEIGGKKYALSVIRDISSRKRMEEELRNLNAGLEQRVIERTASLHASEERYRRLFESAPVPLWEEDWTEVKWEFDRLRRAGITDLRLYLANQPGFAAELLHRVRIMHVNQQTLTLLGVSDMNQVVGSLSAVFSTPETEKAFRRELLALWEGMDSHRAEITLCDRSGDRIHAWLSMTFPPPGARDETVLVSLLDITEQHETEAAIHALNRELLQAKGRAEAADRVKSSFLASMSHELRTPLNSIIGFTGVLLQDLAGPLNPEQAKQLGMVSHSAQHLLALINDVLDISKIEAGQLKVHPERFQLAKSVEKAVESVRPLAHKKNLDLRMELQPIPEPMYSDPRRVEQILLNLLNNAVKFTPQGGISIMLDLSPAPPGVGMPAGTSLARIRVTDTGIGISPEDQRYLFQPFRQVLSELSRRHEGTGLGLAICRRLAVLLGGDITVESETGRGSTFTLLLPLRRGTES